MAYIGNQPVLQSTEFREEFFPSSNQSAFTTGGFHPSAVSVTRNGVLLSESDYTKGSDNVTITLNSAAVSGDVVVIRGNRSLAQGVSVSESRVEYTWQSGDTVVQLNADVIPAYTDVYVNGIKLWYGDGSGDGTNSDYSINAALKQVSFFADPAVGDVIAVVHKNETSALVVSSPTINSITGDIFNGLSTTLTLSLTNGTSSVSVEFYANSTLLLTKSATVSSQSATVTVESSVYSQSVGTIISISVVNSTGAASSNQINKTIIQLPAGGTITTSGGYRYHKFTTSGTFTTYANFSRTVEYLVVAGGGGGGYDRGGGGGAGGLLQSSTSISGASSHTVTIGGGGGGNQGTNSGYGYNSSFGSIATASRGGYGGNAGNAGGGGGSGGGGGYLGGGGSGTSGQGKDGGYGQDAGGGGGGAGVAGGNANGQVPGNGGDGANYSTWATATSSGVSGYYAGGGGGGRDFRYYQIESTGGAGGGGAGGNPTGSGGAAGTANTGGGGGAGGGGVPSYNGAPGGSGIVLIRYSI